MFLFFILQSCEFFIRNLVTSCDHVSYDVIMLFQTFPTFERAILVIGLKIGHNSILLNISIEK